MGLLVASTVGGTLRAKLCPGAVLAYIEQAGVALLLGAGVAPR